MFQKPPLEGEECKTPSCYYNNFKNCNKAYYENTFQDEDFNLILLQQIIGKENGKCKAYLEIVNEVNDKENNIYVPANTGMYCYYPENLTIDPEKDCNGPLKTKFIEIEEKMKNK